MTGRSLPARLAALEARSVPAGASLIIEIVLVGATDGRPDGRRTDWDAHADAVLVNGTRHPVGDDETAHQAVERIVAAMRPQPSAVIAYIPDAGRA